MVVFRIILADEAKPSSIGASISAPVASIATTTSISLVTTSVVEVLEGGVIVVWIPVLVVVLG